MPILLVYPRPGLIRATIAADFQEYGQDGVDWGLRVGMCESGYQPYVKNHTDGVARGVFQFKPATFYANAIRAGVENADIWNWRQQVKVAAYMFGIGQRVQWECT